MEEKEVLISLNKHIVSIARSVALQVLEEELPGIIAKISKPDGLLSDLLTYKQAAALLNVSKPTLHSYIKAGKLSKITFNGIGQPYLSRKEIENKLKKSRNISPDFRIQPGENAA